MSNYRQLNEEIIIDIDQNQINSQAEVVDRENINIFLRDPKNETKKIQINKNNIKLIKELKLEVIIISIEDL